MDKLRKKSMPTVLNMTIMRGINDIYIKDLVEYAANNTFIKGLNLIAYAHTGRGKDNFVEKSIMPDEVVDLLESQTQGLVTKRNVYLFQKLVYAYKLISGQRHCPYLQYFWLVRQKTGYVSIDKYLNLESLGKVFDRYLDIYGSNRIASGVYLFFVLPWHLLSYKTLCLAGDFLAVIIADLFKKSYLNAPENRLFQLVFNTACDCYNADFTIAANCHVGVIYKNQDDKLEILENDGLYLLRH
ncbi:hypothetical protein EPO66_01720 [bacterium]|nr:MAG: hypothetical protein EPO66_01720 [bacterium]